jgi:DNA mismatch repair protein MutS
LQVAQLAGIPTTVIAQAREKLAQLEHQEVHNQIRQQPIAQPQQNDLFTSAPSVAERKLAELNPDNLTPREALDWLYALKKLI